MLTVRNVTVRYGEKTAVENVSFSVTPGQWWMIAGPNGAGKSTLVEAMARGVPFLGGIFWDDREIGSFKSADYAQKVGVLSQIRRVEYAFSVEEVVSLGRYAHQRGFLRRSDAEGQAMMEKALEAAGLTDMRARRLTTLSGGEIQRVFLAQALAQDPALLILDEPANHLDPPYQRQLFSLIGEWLRQPGKAVISVVHDLTAARHYGSHALLLRQGKTVAAGETKKVFTRENLREAYGMDVAAWQRELLTEWAEERISAL